MKNSKFTGGICYSMTKGQTLLGDGSYATALATALAERGTPVTRIDGVRERVLEARGHAWVRGLDIESSGGGKKKLRCDLVAVAATPAPASELPRQHGVRVLLDAAAGGFACQTSDDGVSDAPSVHACGDVRGYRGPAAALLDGRRAGRAAVESL